MTTELAVRYDWEPTGVVTVDEGGKLAFPAAPTTPGLYRFILANSQYVGEASNLRRRFNGYRNPGRTQQTNLRMNPILASEVRNKRGVMVELVTASFVVLDGNTHRLDLTEKPARLLVENAAITQALIAGHRLENLH